MPPDPCIWDLLQVETPFHNFWIRHWNPAKCEAINISNKHSLINMDYHIGCHLVSWSQRIKYLGVIITSKLKWKDQCQFVISKATKHLNRLRQTMFGCTQEAKANAYKALVRAFLEYACAVCNPYTVHDIALLESVQNRAARWIKSSWDSSTFF